MELDLGDLLFTSLLEYCGCDTEEDERTTDSFLITALDSYEREYANAPAGPTYSTATPTVYSYQPHPQQHLQTFRCSRVGRRYCKSTSGKCPQETREDTKYCVNLWEEWRNYRLQHTTATIPLLLEMTNC